MSLQNRVAPDGVLHAVSARGTLMGNRGRIHDPQSQRLTRRRWASKSWIACVLAFKGRHRDVWGESYTELFFLDEVTALAAGHRPCYECRRRDAEQFADAWSLGQGKAERAKAGEIDAVLHAERTGDKLCLPGKEAAALPQGSIAFADGQFLARRGGEWLPWSFGGYGRPVRLAGGAVIVTPASIVAALRAGYKPSWHEGSGAAGR